MATWMVSLPRAIVAARFSTGAPSLIEVGCVIAVPADMSNKLARWPDSRADVVNDMSYGV
jgi:hypothetical protein